MRCSPERPLDCHVARIFLLVSLAYISLNTLRMAVKLAVPAHTVHTIIDGNKVDAVLWKQHFRIHPDLQIVTPEPAHILNDNALDLARLDVGKHPLKSGPVEVGSRISVVLVVVADGLYSRDPGNTFPKSASGC